MASTNLKFGIPDIDLTWSRGGTVNPSSFAGHQLVVLFLPTDGRQEVAELEDYERRTRQLTGTDGWFLAVGSKPNVGDSTSLPVAVDPDDRAWLRFKEVADGVKLERPAGATFFFTRGGAFHRVWPGSGNAEEVVKELRSRL